jgi:D-galactarolactone isomerase
MHIYEDRYPLAPQAVFKPPNAPLADYRAVQKALGLSRAVVVQPNGYGYDNRCTLEALAQLGESARAIAIVPGDVADAELDRLTRAGVRGIRYHLLPGGILPPESLETMAARVAAFGWHVQMQLDGRDLPRYEAQFARLPVPLVIDHNGKFLEPVATDHPGFQALLRLLKGGNTWVKLSAPYETSKTGPPRYADVSALARALVAAAPDRCVWASNWPHPGHPPPVPDTASMLDLLLEWAHDEATRHRILVANPARLYGF